MDKRLVWVTVAAVLILGLGLAAWKLRVEPKRVFCTQDVKLCPDGSYVSRVGPNCEFAPCPAGGSR